MMSDDDYVLLQEKLRCRGEDLLLRVRLGGGPQGDVHQVYQKRQRRGQGEHGRGEEKPLCRVARLYTPTYCINIYPAGGTFGIFDKPRELE